MMILIMTLVITVPPRQESQEGPETLATKVAAASRAYRQWDHLERSAAVVQEGLLLRMSGLTSLDTLWSLAVKSIPFCDQGLCFLVMEKTKRESRKIQEFEIVIA